MLGECCPSGPDCVNLLVLVFVSGFESPFQVDVSFKVLNLSVVDIHLIGSSSPLSSTCSSSDTDFHFHQLIHVAFVVVHVRTYEYVVGEAKMTRIFVFDLQTVGLLIQSSEYAFEYCHKQLR